MLLALTEIIRKSGHSSLEFFQVAFFWKFQKQVDVYKDDFDFRTQGRVPKYVAEYVAHLECANV